MKRKVMGNAGSQLCYDRNRSEKELNEEKKNL